MKQTKPHYPLYKLKWLLASLESGRREVSKTDSFEDGVLSIGGEHIGWKGELLLEKNPRYISKEFFEKLSTGKIKPNDVLLVKDGATIGKVALISKNDFKEAAVNEHVFILRFSKKCDPKFYFFALQSSFIQDQIKLEIRGAAQPGLNSEFKDVVRFPFSSLEKQQEIANFLDKETLRIDALIEEKEKMLSLLEEKRTALISRAVTKGLDPDVKMKSSGLDWLGDIPAHWKIIKLKYIVSKIGSGITPKGGAEVYQTEGIPLLRSQNIHYDGLKLNDVVFISPDIHDSMSNSKVKAGDVLLNITGASIGRCYYVDDLLQEANVNQHVCIIRPKSIITTQFLYYILYSYVGRYQINILQSGSGREGINFEAIANFDIPLPSVTEQIKIVEYLSIINNNLSILLTTVKKSTDLLKERRAALITAAVTGELNIEESA